MNKPEHRWVAKKIGISISGVSLIRSGNRRPSLGLMNNIEFVFDWKVTDQIGSVQAGTYRDDFNRVIEEAYGKETE